MWFLINGLMGVIGVFRYVAYPGSTIRLHMEAISGNTTQTQPEEHNADAPKRI
jgi:hypothetical protein